MLFSDSGSMAESLGVDDDRTTVVEEETKEDAEAEANRAWAERFLQNTENVKNFDWTLSDTHNGATNECDTLVPEIKSLPPGTEVVTLTDSKSLFLGAGSFGGVFRLPSDPKWVVKIQVNQRAILRDSPPDRPTPQTRPSVIEKLRAWTNHWVQRVATEKHDAEWELSRHADSLACGPEIRGWKWFLVDKDVRLPPGRGPNCKTTNFYDDRAGIFKCRFYRTCKIASANTYHKGWIVQKLCDWMDFTAGIKEAWRARPKNDSNPDSFEHPLAESLCFAVVRMNLPADNFTRGIHHSDIGTRNVMASKRQDEKNGDVGQAFIIDYGEATFLPAGMCTVFRIQGESRSFSLTASLIKRIENGKYKHPELPPWCPLPHDVIQFTSLQPPGTHENTFYSVFGVHAKHMYSVLLIRNLVVDALSWFLMVKLRKLEGQMFNANKDVDIGLIAEVLRNSTDFNNNPPLLEHFRRIEEFLDKVF